MLTGATGYLGSKLLDKLVSKGHEVLVLKRSTSNIFRIDPVISKVKTINIDETPLQKCFDDFVPDTILHCATDYGRNKSATSEILQSNLMLPLRLLELGEKFKVKHFINTDTALDKYTNTYSLSKKQFKEWLEFYPGNMVRVNIELEHFYGPGDDKTKFVSYLVHSFLNDAPELNLTLGEQKRDFIYVDDVVDAYMMIAEQLHETKGFYNYSVASNESVRIKDLVTRLQKIAQNSITKINFGAIPYRENEVMESNCDTSAIRKLGWQPKFKLQEGLEKMVQTEIKNKQVHT